VAFIPDQSEEKKGSFVPDQSLVEKIPTEQPGFSPEAKAAAASRPTPEKPSVFESALQAAGAVPVLGGIAKGAQLLAKGGKLAPYASRAAELFIPKTGAELLLRGGGAAAGGAAAQAVSNVLPEDTSKPVRMGAEFVAGMAGELPFGAARQVGRALRPLMPGGVEKAAERVTRKLEPEAITALPEAAEKRTSVMRQMQERLRGAPSSEPVDVTEISRILGTEARGIRTGGEELGKRLAQTSEQRLANISAPRSETEIGEEARQIVNARLEQLKSARQAAVKTNKDAAFNMAREAEIAGSRINNTESFKDAETALKAMKVDPQTKLPIATGDLSGAIDKVRRELTGIIFDPTTGETKKIGVSFQKLENLRRELGDAAGGVPAEGYAALGQQQAGRLKTLVENVMKEFTGGTFDPQTRMVAGGAFEKYLRDYQKASEPINRFSTDFGKKILGKQRIETGEFKTDPMAIPKAIFSSPSTVKDFIELTGFDKTRVEILARNYISQQLLGKSPAQIETFIRANQGWLSEFPAVKSNFSQYAKKLAQEQGVQAKVSARTEERAGRLELGRGQQEQADAFKSLVKSGGSQAMEAAGRVLGKTPEGKAVFQQGIRDIIGTEPVGGLERTYRDKIQPAMRASGLYTSDEQKFIDDAVKQITAVQEGVMRAVSRASQIPGAESSERELTRLISEEVGRMKVGGAVTGGMLAALGGGAKMGGVELPDLGGIGGALGGVAAGALASERYRMYSQNIRKAVSDIVTNPERLKQVMKRPVQEQERMIAKMIRQAVGTQIGVETPERTENAPD